MNSKIKCLLQVPEHAFLGPHSEWILLAHNFLWSSLLLCSSPIKDQGVCSLVAKTFWRWQKRRVTCDIGMGSLQEHKEFLSPAELNPLKPCPARAEWLLSQAKAHLNLPRPLVTLSGFKTCRDLGISQPYYGGVDHWYVIWVEGPPVVLLSDCQDVWSTNLH